MSKSAQALNRVRNFIPVRKIAQDYSNTPRHWVDNNSWKTHFTNALFFLFPEGEHMFVQAVKHFQPHLTDPELRKAVAAFISQEMMHGVKHKEFSQWVGGLGIGADKMFARVNNEIKSRSSKKMGFAPMSVLAETVALEHFTALLAASVLRHPHVLASMHPSVRSLVIWHSIEEIEHKDVAFDVFVAVHGSYASRVVALILVTIGLLFSTSLNMLVLLWRDGELFNLKAAASLMKTLVGRDGLFTTALPIYLSYFKPGFHPSQHDESDLLATWTKKLEELTKVTILNKQQASVANAPFTNTK
jgi:predicted metal-dependent hydrolase